MAESWESLPDVAPQAKESWEDLPDVAAAPAEPAKGVKDYLPEIDTSAYAGPNMSVGQPAQSSIPTMGQGNIEDTAHPPDAVTMEESHREAVKNIPLIPELQGTSASGIRAALNTATLGMAPRILAGGVAGQDEQTDAALAKWHKLYSKATEENPGMALVGGFGTPYPKALSLPLRIALGGTTFGGVYGWNAADPFDTEAKKEGALHGAVVGT